MRISLLLLPLVVLVLPGCKSTPSFEKKFRAIDQNGDGRLSFAEFQQRAAADSFPGRDANRDGMLTKEEWQASGGSGRIFDMVDTDDDGRVSRAEHARVARGSGTRDAFNVIDTDNDGSISLLEASSHEHFRDAEPIR